MNTSKDNESRPQTISSSVTALESLRSGKNTMRETSLESGSGAAGASLSWGSQTLSRIRLWAMQQRWLVEISSCIGGLLCFIVIVVVLRLYDQKAIPKWPLQLTLNTFLAFFTTLAKASVIVPLAEAISQWKWNIYYGDHSKSRPIYDFYILDNASRGFWGSCWLIGRFKWRHGVTVAGVVSILSVLASPVTQQTIEISSRQIADNSTEASVSISRYWDDHARQGSLEKFKAMRDGLISSLKQPPQPLPAVCSTANCSFPRYSSLAVCTKTADVSEHLEVNVVPYPQGVYDSELGITGNSTCLNASLPNGIHALSGLSYSFVASPTNSSLAFVRDFSELPVLSDFFIVYGRAGDEALLEFNGTDDRPWKFSALEVLTYLCVNEYETNVKAGVSSTKVVSSTAALSPADNYTAFSSLDCHFPSFWGPLLRDFAYWCNLESIGTDPRNITLLDINTHAAPGQQKFNFQSDALLLTSYSINDLMWSAYIGDDFSHSVERGGSVGWIRDALWGTYSTSVPHPSEQFSRLERYYSGVATSLSNYIRLGKPSLVLGTAWRDEPFIRIRWGWLTFLGAELLASYVFLVFTIVATRRMQAPILKSSALASLVISSTAVQSSLGSLLDVKGMEARARETKVHIKGEKLELSVKGRATGVALGVEGPLQRATW